MNRVAGRSRVRIIPIILAIFLVSLHSPSILAQPTQTSYTVNLTYLTVQLSYPSEILPGDSVTVTLQANAKNNINIVSLTAQVYYADGASLRQLASATVSSGNYMNRGSSVSRQFQFTVPGDAPRTSLVAVLTENVRTAYTSYYYYPAYYYYNQSYCYYGSYYGSCNYYYSPYCYYDNHGNYYCNYNYNYNYYRYAPYTSTSYSTSTDSGVAPLSYIKATTPEYVSLKSEYQMLQQQLAQSQADNQRLQQNLQNAQNTIEQKDAAIAQKDAAIADLNQQLTSTQSQSGTFESLTVLLAMIAVVLGFFVAYLWGGSRNRPQPRADAEARS